MAPETKASSTSGRPRRGVRRAATVLESTETHYTSPGPSSSQAIPPAPGGPAARAAARVQGSSEARGQTESPTSPRQTRKRKREPPDADVPTNINEGKEGEEGGDDGEGGFACPFFKHNPIAHFLCIIFCFTRYPDLTQHIFRKHTMLLYCPCCYIEFGDESMRDQHIQSRCCAQADPPQHKVLLTQHLKLTRKSKGKVTMLSKWFNAWDILFPGQPKPESALIHRDPRDAVNVVEYIARRVLPPNNIPANVGIFHDLLAQLMGGAVGVPAIVPVIVPVLVGTGSGPTESLIPVARDETEYPWDTQDPDHDVFAGSTGVEFGGSEGFSMMVTPRLTSDQEPWPFGNVADSTIALYAEAGPSYYVDGQDEGDGQDWIGGAGSGQ